MSRVVFLSKLNKALADLVTDYLGDNTDHLIVNFRKDVDGYVVVSPYLLVPSTKERQLLVTNLREMAKAASGPLIKEKYASLISMLSEQEELSINRDKLGAY